ncbi:MAG: NusG domain II-containing protein [Oscillospiraceae bacterium]
MQAKKQNIIFISIILIISAAIAIFGLLRPNGAVAVVSVADKSTEKISLAKDGVFKIENGNLPVTLQVKDGKIRFINSVCPDHVCEGFGWLSKEEDRAVCAPARVVVSIEE